MSAWILLLALAPAGRAAAVDFAHPPASFCAPALGVSDHTPSCAANGTFLAAAKECLDSLNALETTLGAEAIGIAAGGSRSQKGETATGHAEFGFSSSALAYLIAVAATADGQLGDYELYVAPPPVDFEPLAQDPEAPMGWAYGVSCYRDAKAGLRVARAELAGKLKRYRERLAEAKAHEATLSTRGTRYGSISGPRVSGHGAGSGAKAVPEGKSASGSSDITGVTEDKQKRNPGN